MVKPEGILEAALYVSDLTAAETFYRDVLGLQPFVREAGRHVFFRCGDQVFLLFDPEATQRPTRDAALPVPTHGAVGAGHVCFRATAAELDAWRPHLESHGVEIEADFEWPGGGRSLYFRDPSGNSVELAEPRIWGLG